MIVDTHAHCYWDSMLPRIEDIVSNMKKSHIKCAVQIGCDTKTSQSAITLARQFPWTFYATVWLHPETAQNKNISEVDSQIWEFEKLISENREHIVAIGETGFDFHYLDGADDGKKLIDLRNLSLKAQEQIENQKIWWLAQWELAQKYNLPLVIHTRDARDATLDFMVQNNIYKAVIHCYSENPDFAQKLLDFSSEIYFAFGGILTYKNAQSVQETAKMLPINRILLETDAPFLSPQAVRWTINEPANTRFVLEKLCELRNESPVEIENIVYENSLRFYNIQ